MCNDVLRINMQACKLSGSYCNRDFSIGNSIISSAITDKQARVSFKKLQNSASPKDERVLNE